MRRTRGRPLPSGRLSPAAAFVCGIGLAAAGIGVLTLFVNPLTGGLTLLTVLLYVFVLHAPQAPHPLEHAGRDGSGRAPGAWRLDRGHRVCRLGGHRDLLHPRRLADGALLAARLDVPRRLRAGGLRDAPGGGSLGTLDGAADPVLYRAARRPEPLAGRAVAYGMALLRRRRRPRGLVHDRGRRVLLEPGGPRRAAGCCGCPSATCRR